MMIFNNKLEKTLIFCFLIILSLLILSVIPAGYSTIQPGLGQDAGQVESRANNSNGYNLKQLTKFSTGSTRLNIKGSPEGETIYLALPPDANVSSASMRIQGKLPETLNKYTIGGRLTYIDGGDFNKDGKLDILTADLDNHTVYILLNNGKSHFKLQKDYLTGDMPLEGTINDFNNDGYVDIAVVNEAGNTFTVYENTGTGDGGLKNRMDYKIGDWPRDITYGDYNKDGWLDLATITSNDNKVWLSINNKSNPLQFKKPINYSVSKSPVSIASGDLNNDGLSDIVIVNVNSNLTVGEIRYYYTASVFINKGNAEFLPQVEYIIGRIPAEVIIRDFNNDGWMDIASSNRGGYNVSVLLNKGQGVFGNAINYSLLEMPYSGSSMHAGDIDGDGDQDIVSICGKYNIVGVLRNIGDGTFEEVVNYPVPNRPADVFLGDFDNDGDLDITICSQKHGNIAVVSNNGDGTFSTFESYQIGTYPRGITSGDIDGDGDLDLISANYLGGSLTICQNNGKGYFESRYDKEIAVEPFAVLVGDFNNDSYLDLASADEALYKIVLTFNDGDGKFTTKRVEYDIGGYPYSILYHDLNGDGMNEIITGNNAQLSISILRNLGNGTFSTSVEYPFAFNYPFGLAAGDMDGDGDEDIICTNYGADQKAVGRNISIIWNDGNGTFSSHTDYPVGKMPISVRTTDLDLDGDLDIAVSNMGSNTTSILLNEKNITFKLDQEYQVGPGPMCIEIDDLDKDGDPDIVTSNQDNDSISILINQGDGKFKPHKEYLMGAQPVFITISDLNNDGAKDIASANLLSNSISVRMDIHYPSDIKMVFGDTKEQIFEFTGMLQAIIDVPDFSENINTYLSKHKSDTVSRPSGQVVLIPISITSKVTSNIELLDLAIEYKAASDKDGDSIPDVDDEDDDNDQIPDVWEDEHGFAKDDPNDNIVDTDTDGLTNLEEYQNGTDPRDVDTDSDGLTDGMEVKTYGTDPQNEDTDGDNYNDYQEIDKDTDPLDAGDHPKKHDDSGFLPGLGVASLITALLVAIIINVYSIKKHR